MSWGLGWKRPSKIFRLSLNYGYEESAEDLDRSSSSSSISSTSSSSAPLPQHDQQELGFRIDLDWVSGDDEDQVALRLQSQLMVALPVPQDSVAIELKETEENVVGVEMKVEKRREPLRAVTMFKAAGTGQLSDGVGVFVRLLRSNLVPSGDGSPVGCADHWKSITLLSLCGCGLTTLPVELIRLPNLEKLYLDYNKLSVLPPELGEVKTLKVLRVDYNMLVSVPVELRLCVGLVELSLEHNKLVRPLLDFRAMSELQVLKLFGNPLVFLPEILPLRKLRHLSLANIRIVADENLRSVTVQIEMENSSYFGASRHKLSAFFSLIFRFSSCHHPLLASALAKIIMQDQGNRVVVGKDENAVRQLISMISSDNRHVVEQACSALSTLAGDVYVAMQLMKSQKMLNKEVLRLFKQLCTHKNPEVQRLALVAVGNLAFCLENRRILVTSESLRELLMCLTVTPEPCVNKAAARALAILGENENLRRAIRGRKIPKQGLLILSMDGGGMKGLATVQILKEIEKGTGKRIHELFDLICGTSTGGMLAVALGIKLMTLEQCEEIYKNLGKLVFAEPVPKDNEAATWREKLDQLYKSSSQSFRVVVHGSKHSADQFERLLKEMCADEDGDLLIESAVKNIPKVFVVSTLVSVVPAQPFVFRNYQYPCGNTRGASCNIIKFRDHCSRASSAAPFYLDDYSDDVYRWQDGAIVANNPTIFSIREAQLLWPDTKIDCLVSIGCGSVPTKARKGGWRYLDTKTKTSQAALITVVDCVFSITDRIEVMEDDQEIGAYMFRRTVPSLHMTPDDVRLMVGAWRDRIIICTGTYGPTANLIKALLDSGAKAVICPTAEPQDVSLPTVSGSGGYNALENGRFEIGIEDAEDEEAELISPVSDWEDSDFEKNGNHHSTGFWDEEEEELSRFLCQLYDSVFREGARVDVALKNALASHRKRRYSCRLPILK
ncbi:hypothetical protein REPUB_Repub14bG0144100 [Reevesia pubescens]